MTNKKRLFLIILKQLSVAVAIGAVAVVAVYFLRLRIEKIGDSLIEKKQLSFFLDKKSEVLANLKEDMKIVGDNDKKINDAILPADNILEFVAAVDNLSSQNSTQHTLTFNNPVAVAMLPGGSNLYAIDFSISLTGTVYTVASFLKDYDKLPYFNSITGLAVNAPADKGWEGVSTVTIQGRVYAK